MASNAFMDAFARHRQYQGLPATSLALGQILDVGIVSDTPEYQENLHRMGLHGNSEDAFLQFCEAAVLESAVNPLAASDHDAFSKGHLLAGVEPINLQANDKRYPVRDMSWFSDPRFSRLRQAIRHSATDPDALRIADDDDESDSVISAIQKRVARFLYIATNDIDVARPINSYGIDSLVAAELRSWLLQRFGAQVTQLVLLQPAMSVEKLAAEVKASMAIEAPVVNSGMRNHSKVLYSM